MLPPSSNIAQALSCNRILDLAVFEFLRRLSRVPAFRIWGAFCSERKACEVRWISFHKWGSAPSKDGLRFPSGHRDSFHACCPFSRTTRMKHHRSSRMDIAAQALHHGIQMATSSGFRGNSLHQAHLVPCAKILLGNQKRRFNPATSRLWMLPICRGPHWAALNLRAYPMISSYFLHL